MGEVYSGNVYTSRRRGNMVETSREMIEFFEFRISW